MELEGGYTVQPVHSAQLTGTLQQIDQQGAHPLHCVQQLQQQQRNLVVSLGLLNW